MSRIAAEDAWRLLARWSEERAAIQVSLSQGPRVARGAVLDRVLPHSQKALLTLRDENGEAVALTVSLHGAEWTSADATGDGGGVLPEGAEIERARSLTATFSNGNRYVFQEHGEGFA